MLRDALTIPNGVSFVRLLGVPYFWWVLLAQDRVGLAAALIFLIGSTDWIDGYLARRLNQISEVGKVLEIIVRNAEKAGVIDADFARDFLGKFQHLTSEPDKGAEGFGGRFSAN